MTLLIIYALRTKCDLDWTHFKQCRNNVTVLIRQAKRKYYNDLIGLFQISPQSVRSIHILTNKVIVVFPFGLTNENGDFISTLFKVSPV